MSILVDASEYTERPRRDISRQEYYWLFERGAFVDQRVELLDGEIILMSPQNGPHGRIVQLLNRALVPRLLGRADVRVQLPINLSATSEPEPDVALTTPIPDGAVDGDHPREAFLVIEVSESTLRTDLGRKRRLYALAGIPEYWVVDVKARRVRVHRNPVGPAYTEEFQVDPSGSVSPIAFPDVVVPVGVFLSQG